MTKEKPMTPYRRAVLENDRRKLSQALRPLPSEDFVELHSCIANGKLHKVMGEKKQ